MNASQRPGTPQRARSEVAKQERHEAIVRAAREHLIEVGFEHFSMGSLAAKVGIARATLYLYFPTREELLLELYFEASTSGMREFRERIRPSMDETAFVEAFYEAATFDPPLLELAPHLGSVIENNLTRESFLAAKRAGRDNLVQTATLVAEGLDLPFEAALEVFVSLFRLALGARQEMRRPNVDLSELPDDVCETLVEMDEKAAFLRAGVWLVKGARLD